MSRTPDTITPAGTWADRADCREEDPEAWFSDVHAAYAKTVCRRCPVQAACLTDAMQAEGDLGASGRFGIFGGLDPDERAAAAPDFAAAEAQHAPEPQPPTMWRGRPLEPCGTRAAYRRHVRRGEPVCRLCMEAESQSRKDRWQRRRAGEAA